ncbi:[FeFe] hydrogenase H-cluster radical SAM maturase HydE [Clostridia bacterium]|nr:[FeFe] hydrogenase H-cluster radical SAM maturase HydE [Clostridia bacterium]
MDLIDKLEENHILSRDEFAELLSVYSDKDIREYLFERARRAAQRVFGNKIYVRGLIEFTNYCKNNCIYCGIRKDNNVIERYRLSKDDILKCCKIGYSLGVRTFVLQGGEDSYYTPEILIDIVSEIHKNYNDAAITLSVGELPKDVYQALFDAGAARYLLRHETANRELYQKLHPPEMSFDNRVSCLYNLKEIGYQVGCGFMVGSPRQSFDDIIDDLIFINDLSPQMVGIGPFLSHKDTPFRGEPSGSFELTLFLLGIIRLMKPAVLLPATTALGTINPRGRELGIMAGANVVMPNLSPTGVREMYLLYDNKICTGEESVECMQCLARRVGTIGYELDFGRGDSINVR